MPRRKKPQSVSEQLVRNSGALIAQNPVVVGGSTAVMLTLFFVAANALWYQPHGHPGPLFPTRMLQFEAPADSKTGLPEVITGELETTIRIEREEVAPKPVDPTVQKVQSVLSDLNLYTGSIDGIAGPQTRDAIKNYRRIVGLELSDEIDGRLLDQLGTKPADKTASLTPVPVERPTVAASQTNDEAAGDKPPRGSLVVRIQGGLRAFGNDHVEIDGIVGPQTRAAIREFQSLFGLEATGDASAAVLTKMRELGLAD